MKNHTPYTNFVQKAQQLTNEYAEDEFLKENLKAYMPEDV